MSVSEIIALCVMLFEFGNLLIALITLITVLIKMNQKK